MSEFRTDVLSEPAYRTYAILVTYNPASGELERALAAVMPQVQGTVVVDNGSSPGLEHRLPPGAGQRIQFLCLGANYGIAAALNRGIEWARSQGATHVLLLDQDSEPAPDMVKRLHAGLRALERQGVCVAAVGPFHWDPRLAPRSAPSRPFVRRWGVMIRRMACKGREDLLPVSHLITSGSLIPVPVLDQVGPMREELFIDYVDVDWALRADRVGLALYGVCSARMRHTIGRQAYDIPALGYPLPMRTPERNYYLFRNAVLLYGQPSVPLGWKVADASRLLLRLGFTLLFGTPRWRQLDMIFRGITDGLRRRAGPMPPTFFAARARGQ